MSEPNCPVCGFPLEAIPPWNPDIIPIGPENPIESYICNNPDCHGWYDEYCETWRSFGSSCSVCAVRNIRSNTNYQSDDWRGYELYQKLHSSIKETKKRFESWPSKYPPGNVDVVPSTQVGISGVTPVTPLA